MTGRTLFFRRLRKEWMFQLKVIHSVFDWTIVIYLALPAMIIFPFFYIDMWRHLDLYWSAEIPFNFVLFLILLFLLRVNFRSFVHEADVLFVIQQRKLIQSKKRWALLYSVGQMMVGTGIIVCLLLPILYGAYHFKLISVIYLFIFLTSYQLLQLTIKKFIVHRVLKWSLVGLSLIASLFIWQMISGAFLLGLSLIIIGIILYLQVKFLANTNKYFLQELAIEGTERVRYIRIIYNFSQDIKKVPKRYLLKPYFFFPSRRMFQRGKSQQEDGLLELSIKGFMRDRTLVLSYLNLFNLSLIAIYFLPIWLKWLVYVFFLFALNTWLRSVYVNLLDHPFFSVIAFDKDAYETTWLRFRKWLAFPMLFIAGALAILFSFL